MRQLRNLKYIVIYLNTLTVKTDRSYKFGINQVAKLYKKYPKNEEVMLGIQIDLGEMGLPESLPKDIEALNNLSRIFTGKFCDTCQ